MNILEFLDHPKLLGESFTGDTRAAMRSVLAGAFGLPLTGEDLEIFKGLAGDREPPSERVRELWIIAGRRSEKTKTAAAIALYLASVGALHYRISEKLSPGEKAVVSLVAVDRKQAGLAMDYINGLVDNSPILAGMVIRRDTESLHLNNSVAIEINTNSFRAVRGRTLLATIFDEVAFFRSDSTVTPDREVYRAALPGLATLNGLMIGISSPYSRRGLLYDKYRRHFGKSDDVLVVKGASRVFNPNLDARIVEDALRDDPESAKSEWLGEFRSDLEAFVSREAIDAIVRPSPLEIPYHRNHRYFGFVDPSGGGQDEFGMAIGHLEGDIAVVDLIRAQKGTPAAIVAEYAGILKAYDIRSVTSDRYAGSWPADEFARHGISVKHSEKSKSELYIDALPRINSQCAEIPPDEKLINQLCCLERRTSRAGRDSIDHPQGGHDDRANVVAGVIAQCAKPVPITKINMSWPT